MLLTLLPFAQKRFCLGSGRQLALGNTAKLEMRQDRAMPCKHWGECVSILSTCVPVCVITSISVGLSRGASLFPFQNLLEAQNLHVLHPLTYTLLYVYNVNGSLSCAVTPGTSICYDLDC